MLNKSTKLTIIISAVAIMVSAFGIGIASAQEDTQPQPPVREERSNPMVDYLTELGLTAEDLTAAAEAGTTWRELIEGNGGSVADLEALMLAQASERLNTMLDNTVRAPRVRDGRLGGLQEIVELAGLDIATIREGLQSGSSLNDILVANGSDVQAVTDAIIASRTEAINEAVANGRITQEQADERIAGLSETVTTFLNSTPDELRQNMSDGMRDRFQDRRDNRRDGRGGPGGNGAPNNDVPVEATPETSTSS
jgi:hypothetical protein